MLDTYVLVGILAIGLFLGLYPAMQRDENAVVRRARKGDRR